MSGPEEPPRDGEREGAPAARAYTDYAGAVYGSMLAASVVATAGTVGDYPRVQLAVLLVVTGVVFWAAHVYARLAGERRVGKGPSWREARRIGRHERPIIEAALPPAAAVLISPLLGLGLTGTSWLALGVAVAQQVGWAFVGAVRAGASRRQAAIEGLANLVLGLIIVAAKAALGH
ncbi:hypothetical protein AB0M29_14530 [Streptomyces sp. NPDC051976]|uniref:hypothetical protein n=1 Tax=Streptomyces sp. NPDC051976 TaxID=3154947 RepID=UPI00343DE706